MKPLPMLLLGVLLSAVVASATVAILVPTAVEGAQTAEGGTALELAQLQRELEAQGQRLRELADRLEMRAPQASLRTPVGDLESMVRLAVAEQLDGVGAGSVRKAGDEQEFSADSALSDILEMRRAGAGYEEIEAYWRKLRKEGRVDELVAAFEEYAELNPADPEAQVLLGNAYIQRLQESPNGPEMGEWAMKADGAFDTALGLDDTNWEARLSKAVSLSFWPPIFGKQGDAIDQFQILLDQQKNSPPNSDHAQTYQFLGNLYQQQGDSEKAQKIWGEGLAAFPEDEALVNKMSSAASGQ